MSLQVSKAQERYLRTQKTISDETRHILNESSTPEYITQFYLDLRVSGLWVAILYVRGYERRMEGYTPGSADRLLASALNLPVPPHPASTN